MGLDMYLNANGEEIGYWRKANAIHLWFVKNVQEGDDNCGEYPVTKEKLQELRDLCQKVIDSSKLIEGNVQNGFKSVAGGPFVPIYEPGKIIEDPSVAIELLPLGSGFFFSSTQYDEGYLDKLKDTVKFCNLGLQHENVTYQSSW